MMRVFLRSFGAACCALGLAACDDGPGLPPGVPPLDELPAATIQPTTTEPSAAASAPDAAGDAGADGGGSVEALAGTWEGKYDAKKGRVAMPSDVKDLGRDKDDGKQASGAGAVTLIIGLDGEVTGKSQGVLGAARVRGKIDGKMLRASFVPDDPLAPNAMTGVLIGPVKGDIIQAELRVAGPDALIVRQSTFELKKK